MNKFATYFAIEKELHKLGDPVERSIMVQTYSRGRMHSLQDLGERDLQEFNNFMRNRLSEARIKADDFEKCNRIRRKIIALFHKMDWKLPNGNIDLERLNAWAVKYGQYHKPFMKHNHTELTHLCSQAEQVYKTFIEAV